MDNAQTAIPTTGAQERELVINAVRVIHQYRDKDEDEIINELIASGVQDIDAERALLFIETAFARVMLSNSGASFSDLFTVHSLSSKSKVVQACFSLEPIYQAAVSVAQDAVSGKTLSREEFASAACRGWECNAVSSIQSRGENPINYEFGPSAFFSMNDQVFEKWKMSIAVLRPSSKGPNTPWTRLRRLVTRT